MADGKVSMPHALFLGYEKGEDGLPTIVESEAKIVRMIFELFMEGKTPSAIAKYLVSFEFDRAMQEYSDDSMQLFKAQLAQRYKFGKKRLIFTNEALWRHFIH